MRNFDSFDKKIKDYIPDLSMKEDVALSGYTSFKIGGAAKRVAFPEKNEQLILVHSMALQEKIPSIVIGNGSNMLFSDDGYDGLVISTSKLTKLTYEDNVIQAASGVLLSKLSSFAADHSLTGLEFAHGIPGSVGGAVSMNAGAYGEDIGGIFKEAMIYSPEEGILHLTADQMDFGYRHSYLTTHPDCVVLEASFILDRGLEDDIRSKMKDLLLKRKSSQPLEFPSAGSVFKRPEGYFAGKLIEDSGLKGRAIGGAMVSPKHAGFIVNTGNATCKDVLSLIRMIQEIVMKNYGVLLETEVKVVK